VTGLNGVYYPLRGKTISCSTGWQVGLASVSAAGTLNLQLWNAYSGWTNCGLAASCSAGYYLSNVSMTTLGIAVTGSNGSDPVSCAAVWPST